MKKLLLSLALVVSAVSAFSQRTVYRNAEEKLNDEYCTGLFRTSEATYFDMVNDNRNASSSGYLNILDWLQGRVAGLQIYTTRQNDRLPYIRNSRASIYIDEILVSADYLNSLSVADIGMIKIIKPPFAGFGGPGGVIAIYTIGTEEDEEE